MRKIPPYLMLDAWRGLASLWVVMIHSCLAFIVTGDNLRYLVNPVYGFSVWGRLGVVVFFVVSGYCIMGAAYGALSGGKKPFRYGLDRIRRIYPPYLAALALSVVVAAVLGAAQKMHVIPEVHHSEGAQGAFHWFVNLFLVQVEFGDPSQLIVAWSLCYEVAFYLLLGLMLWAAEAISRGGDGTRGLMVFQVGISLLTLASIIWVVIAPRSCPFPLDLWYQFGMGALLFLLVAAGSSASVWSLRAVFALVEVLVILRALHPVNDSSLGHPDTSIQAAACAVFVLVLLLMRPFDALLAHRLVLRPLVWLGTISYSLYLVHPLFIGFADAGGRKLGLDHDRYWVTFLVQIGVAIVAGWIFFLLVERHFISSRQKKRVVEELSVAEVAPAGAS